MSELIASAEAGSSVAIIGGGLAALIAANRVKDVHPDSSVVIIEKPIRQSNSQISGQRYRAGKSGERQDSVAEITGLLASRNDLVEEPQMFLFSKMVTDEIFYWQSMPDFVSATDKKEWFGPQWGKPNTANAGRGKSVMDWFRGRLMTRSGVSFFSAEATSLDREGEHIRGVHMVDLVNGPTKIIADSYVLAGGSIGGTLFNSTNRTITNSPQELAFAAGLELIGGAENMLHPFGRSDAAGNHKLGCYETDMIKDADVYLANSSGTLTYDSRISTLLKEGQAHYHFPDITRLMMYCGGIATLKFPDETETRTRVSHHYSHLGLATDDGVRVHGIDNLYAIGDASSISYWTAGQERLPGYALSKCLVDAYLLSQHVPSADGSYRIESSDRHYEQTTGVNKYDLLELKNLNTKFLLNSKNTDSKDRTDEWYTALDNISVSQNNQNAIGNLIKISQLIARSI